MVRASVFLLRLLERIELQALAEKRASLSFLYRGITPTRQNCVSASRNSFGRTCLIKAVHKISNNASALEIVGRNGPQYLPPIAFSEYWRRSNSIARQSRACASW